ncbi:MAG TPA: glycosyl hydrolase [Acidobacteriaceae bacterium]|nr:glycosyl hydrolase [Acidobacteriaceae bacterium]
MRTGRLLKITAFATLFAAALHGQTPTVAVDGLRDGFRNPPAAARLRCYWWWLKGNTTAETITHDLEAMKAQGYGGAILVDADGSGQEGNAETPSGPPIGSPPWLALFVHALAVAQKLDLEMSLNVTSRWDVGIIGGGTVKPEDAMKLLTWSRTVVSGGGAKTLRLATPRTENGFYRPIAALAYPLRHGAALAGSPGSGRAPIVHLAFKTASMETGFSMPRSGQVMREAPPVGGEEDAELGEVVDVTSHMGADGTLQWNFPAGTWEVVRIGYTDSALQLLNSAGRPAGLPLDAMSTVAFDHYWHDAVMPLLQAAQPYIGSSLRGLVTDSWEAGGTNWDAGFREEFKRRRGYDPVPYLPIVAGRILSSRETSNRFLFDLRRTVADLIAENYYDRFADHARQRGLETHPEAGGPHGAPIDALLNFRSTSFPQTEFWVISGTHRATDDQRFFVKEASSAAHIYGKPFASAEGPTSMNPAAWSESLEGDLQPTLDHAFTEGLNRLYWHEFTSSPAVYGLPGQEYFAGTHLNPNVTWWKQAGPFLLALNRAQFLMQQGQPVSDLLYFYGDQVPGFVRLRDDDPAHLLPGYDYDVVNEDALLHRMEWDGSGLRTPEGVKYRALALPDSGRLSWPALEWMSRFVRQGGVAIGEKPSGPLGLIPSERREEYARLADAMWAGCGKGEAVAPYGQGRIDCTTDARRALAAMGVAPDFSYALSGKKSGDENDPALEYVHRRTAGADIYFVRSTRMREVQATLSFRIEGRAPELWAPDDGTTAPALIYRSSGDGRTEIPLTFPPRGSVFLIFARPAGPHLVAMEREGSPVFPSIRGGEGVFSAGEEQWVATAPGTYTATDSNGGRQKFVVPATAAEPLGGWTLSFPGGWGAPPSVRIERFESWTESTNPGIRYFSGTAVYRSSVTIAAGGVPGGQQFWLNLGRVREIASVLVNGRRIDTVWRAPFAVRIDPLLHAGDNTIEIEVTNLWPNRLIGDLQPSATRHYTHTNVHAYRADSPLLPSGILEPVVLQQERVLGWK